MKIKQLTQSALLLIALFGLIACSSTGEPEVIEPEVVQESDSDRQRRIAQEQAAEAERRAAEEQQRVIRAALGTTVFYFDFDIAEFRPADRDVLTVHAQDLAANSSKRLRLEGHADERGTREYNLALGERRANAIRDYLIVNGASRAQLEVVSYGEERPAEQGQTEQAYQQNRRVELVTN